MKLNYKIIWVEDKIEDKPFQNLINEISQFVSDHFFDVEIQTAEDFEDFKEKFSKNGSYDLVITDYSLNDSHGDQVIDFIRMDKNILTEVFFYSANRELKTVILANRSRISYYQLEGTGYHKELKNRIEELIALTIAKFEHIVAMRGMIMHETSILDEQTFKMVSEYITSNDDEVRIKLFDELISFFERKHELVSKCKKNNNVNNIIKDPLLLSFAQRANVLSSIIDKIGFEDFISKFKEEIINVRNQFAHAVLEIDSDGREYFNNKQEKKEFNSEYCKQIRRDIIKHKLNLDNLEKKVNE